MRRRFYLKKAEEATANVYGFLQFTYGGRYDATGVAYTSYLVGDSKYLSDTKCESTATEYTYGDSDYSDFDTNVTAGTKLNGIIFHVEGVGFEKKCNLQVDIDDETVLDTDFYVTPDSGGQTNLYEFTSQITLEADKIYQVAIYFVGY